MTATPELGGGTAALRIAVIGPTFPYKGGGAHHTTELAHRLAASGHEVVLESWRAQYPSFLYPGQQTITEPEGAPFPATRRELSWRRPDGWLAVGRALRSYDLVVLAVLSSVQVPAYLGILRGVRGARPGGKTRATATRVTALCHNVLPHEPKPYDRPLMRALLRRVDGVLVHTDRQADLARTLTSRPVTVAEMPAHLPTPRGDAFGPASDPASGHVSDPVYDPSSGRTSVAESPGGADAGTGTGTDTPHRRLLFFGIVRPYKGLDVLLRALAAGPPDVSLTVAGEFWGGLDETRGLIAELGLTERVLLRPGYVPAAEVPGLFAEADALVLPYRSATASQNVWMAYEHGVPVIATRVGGFAGQIRDGEDGLLCEPDDVPSLADALKRFYADGESARLTAGVSPVDTGPIWDRYLKALLSASS